jgi:hypothetical protein
MFWLIGSILLVAWIVAAFGLHHTGYVHVLLLASISFFVIQFAQDRRTRAHQSQN